MSHVAMFSEKIVGNPGKETGTAPATSGAATRGRPSSLSQ
jgi:hypothetical protein